MKTIYRKLTQWIKEEIRGFKVAKMVKVISAKVVVVRHPIMLAITIEEIAGYLVDNGITSKDVTISYYKSYQQKYTQNAFSRAPISNPTRKHGCVIVIRREIRTMTAFSILGAEKIKDVFLNSAENLEGDIYYIY